MVAIILLSTLGCRGLIRLGRHNPRPGTVIVVHVGIEGGGQVDEDAIVDHLETYSDNLGSADTKPLLDVSGLDEDDRRVEAIYAANGFFSARCLGHRIEEVDDVSVRVFFQVEEGKPTNILTIDVHGFLPDEPNASAAAGDPEAIARLREIQDDLSRWVPIDVGDRWNEAVYLASNRALQAELRYRGFVHAEVLGRSEVDVLGRTVAVIIDAVPGPLTRIASIRVQGITGITTERLLRRVDLEPGDIVDLDEFEKIEGRLFDLGVFYSVAVKPDMARIGPNLSVAEIVVRQTVLGPVPKGDVGVAPHLPGDAIFARVETALGTSYAFARSRPPLLGLPLVGFVRSAGFELGRLHSLMPTILDRSPGALYADLTITGTIGKPVLEGAIRARFDRLRLLPLGLDQPDADITLRLRGQNLTLWPKLVFVQDGRRVEVELGARFESLTPSGIVLTGSLEFDRFPILRRQDIAMVLSGRIDLAGTLARPAVKGQLHVDDLQVRNEVGLQYELTRRLQLDTRYGDAGAGGIDMLYLWRF